MGHYKRGDVVIAPVAFEERNGIKTRPAVVIATGRNNEVYVCPVSSKPSFDTPVSRLPSMISQKAGSIFLVKVMF